MTDEQFVQGMWRKAQQIKRHEQEVQDARTCNKHLRRRSFIYALACIVVVALFAAIYWLFKVDIVLLAILPLWAAYVLDPSFDKHAGYVNHYS